MRLTVPQPRKGRVNLAVLHSAHLLLFRAFAYGYLFTSGNAFRAGITPTNWSGEKVTAKTPGSNLARGQWKTVTYTQVGTTGTLYEDGAKVGENTAYIPQLEATALATPAYEA